MEGVNQKKCAELELNYFFFVVWVAELFCLRISVDLQEGIVISLGLAGLVYCLRLSTS